MKTQRIILFGLLMNMLVAQDPITVSNVSGVSANYSSLQAALDTAPDSSTIYVYASPISYGDINITKQVFLYGAGMYPDTPGPLRSKLGNVAFATQQNDSSNGSTLSGFEVSTTITLSTDMHDITIERNKGENIVLSQNDNIMIINNYLGMYVDSEAGFSIYMVGSTNVSIINNYIHRTQSTSSSGSAIFYGGNALIVNNDIHFFEQNHVNGFFRDGTHIVENNIFTGNATPGSNYLSQFNNNMSFDSGAIGQYNNNGSGNIIGTPVYASTGFGDQDWYGLDWGSPGLEAGTDGTDLGIQGGFYVFSNAYMPPLPYVQQLQVPAVVPLNGLINVKITGKSHN